MSRSCRDDLACRVPSAVLCWLAAAADGMDESAWASASQSPCRGRSMGRPGPSEPLKLPSEPPAGARSLHQLPGRLRRPAPSPHRALLRRKCSHCSGGVLSSIPSRGAAPSAAESSPGGCSASAVGRAPARSVGAPPEPLPMVAKCSVMIGGHQVSSRRLLGRPGRKSGSAGSSWRPQHTRKSRAARTMAPVQQDKPRHSIDLAELCSPILWSALFPFRS